MLLARALSWVLVHATVVVRGSRQEAAGLVIHSLGAGPSGSGLQ